jgi:hypothetical protein
MQLLVALAQVASPKIAADVYRAQKEKPPQGNRPGWSQFPHNGRNHTANCHGNQQGT